MAIENIIEKVALSRLRHKPYVMVASGTHDYLGRNLELSYKQDVLDLFVHNLSLVNGNNMVLDLGCGCGDAADYLDRNGFETVRLDISKDGLVFQSGSTMRVMADINKLPLSNSSVVGVHIKDALVHIANKRQLFREIRRVLVPGGRMMVISTENPFFSLLSVVYPKLWSGLTYFPVNEKLTLSVGLSEGFGLSGRWEWEPGDRRIDWYRRRNSKRFVLEFEK